MIQDERRSFPRYLPSASLTATASFPTKAEEHISIKDIGIDGFCFVTGTDISGESVLELSLNAGGDSSSGGFEVSAKIIWHIHDEATALHTAGAQFMELSEADREALQEFFGAPKPTETEEESSSADADEADS